MFSNKFVKITLLIDNDFSLSLHINTLFGIFWYTFN